MLLQSNLYFTTGWITISMLNVLCLYSEQFIILSDSVKLLLSCSPNGSISHRRV